MSALVVPVLTEIDAGLVELRARAEEMMTTMFAAYAPDEESTDADGQTGPGYAARGATIGKVQGTSAVGKDAVTRTVSIGDVALPVIDEGLHIPIDKFIADDGTLALVAGSKGVGWELEVTAVAPVEDQTLVGRRYLVVSAPAKSRATARRLDVVELPRPKVPSP